MVLRSVAALWDLAEATLFFVVPDVGLSWAGRSRLARGLVANRLLIGGWIAFYAGYLT